MTHKAVDEIDTTVVETPAKSDPSRSSVKNRPAAGAEKEYRECFMHLAELRRITGSRLEFVEKELVKEMFSAGIIGRPGDRA